MIRLESGLEKSIVLITSSIADVPDFGTGFIICRDSEASYIITCAHVVRDVGGIRNVLVNGLPAEVVSMGDDKGCDLSILKILGEIGANIFELTEPAISNESVVLLGFSQDGTKTKKLKSTSGRITDKVIRESSGQRTTEWQINIDPKSSYKLQPGYSGSPVLDRNNRVVAVVAQRQDDAGIQGTAIDIGSVRQVWQNIPQDLIFHQRSKSEQQFLADSNLSWLEAGIVASPIVGAIGCLIPYGDFIFVGTVDSTAYGLTPLIIDLLSFLLALSATFSRRLRQQFSNKYINLLLLVVIPLIISNLVALSPVLSMWYDKTYELPRTIKECAEHSNPITWALSCLPMTLLMTKLEQSMFTPGIGYYVLILSGICSISLWLAWFLQYRLRQSN